MKKYVVDASVVLVGILESNIDLVKEVRKIFLSAGDGNFELISSQFQKIEVSNGMRFNERDMDKAIKLFRVFLNLPIKYRSFSSTLYEQSLLKSYELGTTVYDTSYHILALSLGATFLTCDEDYYRRAKKLGSIELITAFKKSPESDSGDELNSDMSSSLRISRL